MIRHERNTHIAGAVLDGMRYALAQGYDYVITMDAGRDVAPEMATDGHARPQMARAGSASPPGRCGSRREWTAPGAYLSGPVARPGSHRCWDSILSYFFSVAEITGGGFAFPGLFQDAVSNDYNPTAIGDTIVLQAGGAYRLGIGAATDHLCTSTDSALCPALDPNEPVSTPAQPAGFFTQSGSAEFNFTLTPVAVPEPGGALLLGAGLALVAARKRG